MRDLIFKVSAKTARLFGRENASNAEAAISELIKNTYDADASTCLVCFLPRYSSLPGTLSAEEYQYLAAREHILVEYFKLEADQSATLRELTSDQNESAFATIKRLIDLWVIDNGSGMSAKTIEECWMVIGTNDKEINVISEKGRARTGAKGIGRFALDRLGNSCTLYSSSKIGSRIQSIRWEVDWSDFDEEGKVLDEITARMYEDVESLQSALSTINRYPEFARAMGQSSGSYNIWSTGTAIRIGFLRDPWNALELTHLNKTLGALIPPLEQKELNLFLFDATNPTSYGCISTGVLDDYDYKLQADVRSDGTVHIDLFRNELDRANLDSDLFSLKEMQMPRFTMDSLSKEKCSYCESIETLFPGENENFYRKAKELGPFRMQLLFFKRGSPSRRDAEIYPYRQFQPGPRKNWLEEFGGIKIYRDNFAVRPYGELHGRAFDWLALGQRVAISPVAASRKGWKVSPQNLAGTVMISRAANARLYDQTNREGIIENEHFSVFRTIVLRVIQEFEDDRSYIHFNLNELYRQKNKSEIAKEAGAIAANRIVREPEKATREDAKQLAKAFVAQQEEIRELRDEQTMLRALATLGTYWYPFPTKWGSSKTQWGPARQC